MAAMLDVLSDEFEVADLADTKPGQLILMREGRAGETVLALRVDDHRDVAAFAAVLFRPHGASGKPLAPAYVRFQPAVSVPCVVLGAATIRIEPSAIVSDIAVERPGSLLISGKKLYLIAEPNSRLIDIKASQIDYSTPQSTWYVSAWHLGVINRAEEFVCVLSWKGETA